MMGAGKSTIGRRLATRVGARFVDADEEIERAAGRTIPEIFATYGEEEFRDGERKVIARLLEDEPHVLAMGGGAFVNDETRAATKASAMSVWLKTDLETLHRRVLRRANRPMLFVDDPKAELEKLLAARTPSYSEADIIIESGEWSPDLTAEQVEDALIVHGAAHQANDDEYDFQAERRT
jgi:shikimate kinase